MYPYAPRPVIYHRIKGLNERPKTYTYTEAVERFGREISQDDLQWAYKTARGVFDKELEQTFIVMRKEESEKIVKEILEKRKKGGTTGPRRSGSPNPRGGGRGDSGGRGGGRPWRSGRVGRSGAVVKAGGRGKGIGG